MVAQMVWFRHASQILGQSATTVAAVVAMALTGLALGNFWGSHFAAHRPGRYLAAAGVTMLVSEGLLSLIPIVETALCGQPLLWSLIVSSPLLVINFFAGVVFPRLLAAETQTAVVGLLNAWETTGACVGAMTTGCFAIQTIGLMPTFITAAIIALIVGLLINGNREVLTNGNASFPNRIAWGVIAAVFVSGIASLGLEIVWQRLLILIVGTDSYSYAIVVTSYLLGVAAGAYASGIWIKNTPTVNRQQRLRSVAVLQILGAVISLLTLAGIISLASGVGQTWSNQSLLGFEIPLLKRFFLCIALLLIPAAIQGGILPMVVDAVTDSKHALDSPAGTIYGVLAIGNVTGILLCGFLLIPAIGLQQSVLVFAGIAMIAALIWAQLQLPPSAIVAAVALVILCGHRYLQQTPVGLAIDTTRTDLLFYREGPANTVAVLAEKSNPDFRRITVDGIIVGQSGKNAEEKQLMLAHLPAMLNHHNAAIGDVAVVGLGSGLLSAEIASIPGVNSVTTAELSPAVIQASQYFSDLFPAPGSAIHAIVPADALDWLNRISRTNRRFDVIISDGKSRPGHIGNAAFFSSDYYRSAIACLCDTGKFVQWYSLDAAVNETKIVLKTFAANFPHAAVAIAAPDSIYLVGSPQPITASAHNVQSYLNQPTTQSLRSYHWKTADDLRSMGWVRLRPNSRSLHSQPINTRNRPILERFSYDVAAKRLTENKRSNLNWLKSLIMAEDTELGIFVGDKIDPPLLSSAASTVIDAFDIVLKRKKGWLDHAAQRLNPVLTVLPKLHRSALLSNSYLVAAEIAAKNLDSPSEVVMLIKAGDLCPADGSMQLKIGNRLLALGDPESALRHFLNAIDDGGSEFLGNKGAAIALLRMQKQKMAARYFEAAIQSPVVRSDGEFMALSPLFQTQSPAALAESVGAVNKSEMKDSLRPPESEQEMIDRLNRLLEEPVP